MVHYDGSIMMTRTQLSFEREMLHRARAKASQLGLSLAEYVRRLVAEDLGEPISSPDLSVIFDLGASGGSNVAREKNEMLRRAFSEVAL